MGKKATSRTPPKSPIPPDQLDLPVSIDSLGNYITLREFMQPSRGFGMAPPSLATLSPERRAEVTVKRIEAQPKFELAMIGGGIIDKKRAIEEVKSQSDIGRLLVEIEQNVINHLLQSVPS